MSNGFANAFLNRGKKLLETCQDKLKDEDHGKCDVSPDFPWLVCWLAEAKIGEIEEKQEKAKNEGNPLIIWGMKIPQKMAFPVIVLFILAHIFGWIDLSAVKDKLHGVVPSKDVIEEKQP